MQDLKMTDHEDYKAWKCKTWKMTDHIAGPENAGPENDGQNLLQNTGPENDGLRKSQGLKMQDLKMTDQFFW